MHTLTLEMGIKENEIFENLSVVFVFSCFGYK